VAVIYGVMNVTRYTIKLFSLSVHTKTVLLNPRLIMPVSRKPVDVLRWWYF